MTKEIPIISVNRSCGECTVCCEGFLEGEVRGHKFMQDTHCYFLEEKKCTIYNERPEDPCRKYNCFWKINYEIPDDMRPDISKVVMTTRNISGINYLQVTEVNKKIDSLILANIIQYADNNNINLEYQVAGQYFYLGTRNFLDMVNIEKDRKLNT